MSNDRSVHDRTVAHVGIDEDLFLILSEAIDVYTQGEDLHDVLVDLDERITALEQA